MKANELRIGNYVMKDGYEIIVSPYNISELYVVVPLDEYEPIPLTEEWLIKFGFDEYESDVNVRRFYDKTIWLCCYKHGFNGYWLRYYMGPSVQKLIYVHQLQNLYFALTGQELNYEKEL